MTTAACVLGDLDLVRPLRRAGLPVMAVGSPTSPTRLSRAIEHFAPRPDSDDELLDTLEHWARSKPERPVLYYQSDQDLLFVSRHRDRLQRSFRFVIASSALVEDLVDKGRFEQLATRTGLPVPTTRPLPDAGPLVDLVASVGLPLIVKPSVRRDDWWHIADAFRKAVRVDTTGELVALRDTLTAAGCVAIAQEYVAGPETRIESYHCYVDASGATVAEFTGRKIRTKPVEYGHTTALVITAIDDVAHLGRDVVERLELHGVAKLDFKRDPEGRLHLLEINPRFNLWHFPGAVAGVNLPALVWADCTGAPRPLTTAAVDGVTWCHPWNDARALSQWDEPLRRWLPWMLRTDAKAVLDLRDPMPFIRGIVAKRVADKLLSVRAGRGGEGPTAHPLGRESDG